MDASVKPPEYVSDKGLRLRSYFRRRPVPFKRLLDLDLTVGTASFLLSLCEEVEEVTFVGDEELVGRFLQPGGLTLVDALLRAKRAFRIPRHGIPDGEEEEAQGQEDEEEYFSTVEERRKVERAKKREAAQRLSDGEFIRSASERSKVFSARKDSLMAKVKEMDTVCGSKSFLLIVSPEKEAAYYQGSSELVSQFFDTGLSSAMVHRDINVRPFEPEETDCNICSVPHCNVSRNTLSKWRLAAMDLFGFPDNIPMTMYACPEADREQWIAELDLDPGVSGKITVCSLHFREGFPTEDFPYPTELLSESNSRVSFMGSRPSSWRKDAVPQRSPEDVVFDVLEDVLSAVDKKAKENEERRSALPAFTQLVIRPRGKRLRSHHKHRLKSGSVLPFYKKIVRFYIRRKQVGTCHFCRMKWCGSRELFEHIRVEHFGLAPRGGGELDEDSLQLELSAMEKKLYLEKLYPVISGVATKNPRKKYVCGVCQSSFDLHGIFIHMKQMHKGMLCQYCLKLFMEVGELESHLKAEHRLGSRYYHSLNKFTEISGSRYNFVCGTCNKLVRLGDLKKSLHKCPGPNPCSPTNCPHCERGFNGSYGLEMHLVNGWCKAQPGRQKEVTFKEASKLYRALTGKALSQSDVAKYRGVSSLPEKKDSPSSSREFSVADRQILMKYHSVRNNKKVSNFKSSRVISTLPLNGNIFCGAKSRGISNNLRKEIKEEGVPYEDIANVDITRCGKNLVVNFESPSSSKSVPPLKLNFSSSAMQPLSNVRRPQAQAKSSDSSIRHSSTEDKENLERFEESSHFNGHEEDGATPSSKESKLQRLQRDYEEIVENLSNLRHVIEHFGGKCLVCQQAHLVCVDSIYLLTHMTIVHEASAVGPLLKEDPSKAICRMKRYLKDTKSKEIIFSYQQDKDLTIETYSCSYCPSTSCLTNEDLFRHLEKEHSQKVLTCNLCQSIFLNYGSFISHVCYGPPTNSQKQKAAKFNCKVCLRQDLSSFLIFQNHVRRDHNICEICFKCQGSQESLYSHCLEHSQELMCMKCFLAYDEYDQFRKHLYYKHYDECRICGICYQKTWPHVYHFCIQDLPSSCEVCDKKFISTKQYRVHMRTHTNVHPYSCSANNCSKSFISKQLLWKHQIRRHPDLSISATKALEDKRNSKEVLKYKASSIRVVRDIQSLIQDLICDAVVERPLEEEPPPPEELPPDPEPEKEIDPLQAAVASIMGEDGIFNTPKSPVKPSVNLSPSPATPTKSTVAPGSLPNNNFSSTSSSSLVPPASLLSPSLPQGPKKEDSPKIMHPSEYFNKRKPSAADSDMEDSDEEELRRKKRKNKSLFPIRGASSAPVVGGIWNQELLFVSNGPNAGKAKVRKPAKAPGGGLKVMKPITEGVSCGILAKIPTTTPPPPPPLVAVPPPKSSTFTSLDPNSITKKLGTGGWEVCLSESSGDSDMEGGPDKPKKVKMIDKIIDRRIPVMDHDYCYESYMLSLEPPKPPELSEMDKILSNVALGVMDHLSPERSSPVGGLSKKKNKHKKNKHKESKKKKKKKRKNKRANDSPPNSSDSEDDRRASCHRAAAATTPFVRKSGPKPKYHTPLLSGAGGVTAGTGRITFNSSSEEDEEHDERNGLGGPERREEEEGSSDICSSDLDTDFSAEEFHNAKEEEEEEAPAAPPLPCNDDDKEEEAAPKQEKSIPVPSPPVTKTQTQTPKPTLKLKIKLPSAKTATPSPQPTPNNKLVISSKAASTRKRHFKSLSAHNLSKKMRESLALNRESSSSNSDGEETRRRGLYSVPSKPKSAYVISDAHGTSGLMYNSDPERLYCVCQCPHDDVSEMIGCDAPDCIKEWFHFECVGILVPPAGKWYCPECSNRYKIRS